MPERVWKRLFLIASFAVLPACGGEGTEPDEPTEPPEVIAGPDTPGRFYESPDAVPGQYIVVLKEHAVAASDVPEVARALTAQYGGTLGYTYSHAPRGFSMQAPEEQARALASHRLVDYVAEDGRVYLEGPP